MIIGITGTIGSGKSTVARIFERHGFRLIDADEIGHRFLGRGTSQYAELVAYFGREILDGDGNIDRMKLGALAFSEKKNYRKLNSIMLPKIIKEIGIQIKKIRESGGNAVLDAPLLLETRAKELVDKIAVVKTSHEIAFRRNRKFSTKRMLGVLECQMPIAEKLKHADFVINNNGNAKSLEPQVQNIIKAIS